jgi:tRNA-dihydrouridine synthase B
MTARPDLAFLFPPPGRPFLLAPLAGYTDVAFRQLCREYGAAMCFSEMISSHGLVYDQKKTRQMTRTVPAERPVALQLFGAKPEIMGAAAAILTDLPIDVIDINMGCPVKKVIKSGSGAALMKDPRLAASIIGKVVRNTHLPVSVKIRSGWAHDTINAESFARMAADAGAALITVHGRTQSQGFGGRVDRQIIRKVKQAVTIPVIGNGDIHTYQEGLGMLEETGCDAVMIGRAALGKPWVFQPRSLPDTLMQRITAIQRHLELIDRYFEAERILARIKNHTGRYLKNIHGGAAIRSKIYTCSSFAELQELIDALLHSSPL